MASVRSKRSERPDANASNPLPYRWDDRRAISECLVRINRLNRIEPSQRFAPNDRIEPTVTGKPAHPEQIPGAGIASTQIRATIR